jgi:hypothetical protein
MGLSRSSQQLAAVVRAIGNGYVLWLQTGNRFLWLEEPAFFVAEQHLSGSDRDTISRACASRYGVGEPECLTFVDDIVDRIEGHRESRGPDALGLSATESANAPAPSASLDHHYSINGKVLGFHYGKGLYEHYLHPLLKHLETEETANAVRSFELSEHNARVVLRVDGQVKGAWREDETHLLKGAAFLQILNAAYERTNDDWMAAVHASAVTDGQKAVLFSARPGSGKSTLGALLCHEGYLSLSDDFVPIERESRMAFPFPAAMSVKRGALTVVAAIHPTVLGDSHDDHPPGREIVAYVPLPQQAQAVPVSAIVFVKYDPEVDCEMEQLPAGVALGHLLDETWTHPSAENAGAFLDWFCTLSCYRLTYSTNEKALRAVAELFER